MRRVLSAFVLVTAAAMALTACSDNKNPSTGTGGAKPSATTGTSSPAGSPSPGALPSVGGGVPGGADVKTVCAGYNKVAGASGAKFTAVAQKLPDAMRDQSKAPAVIAELKAVLAEYQSGLSAEAARSADAELRAAIEADVAALRKIMAGVEASGNDIQKVVVAVNTPEFQKLGEKVKALCEK